MTTYKIEDINGLTDGVIKAMIPTVYAPRPYPDVSPNYLFIPTYKIIGGLRNEDFVPTMVGQSKSRDENNQMYTKHILWFRHVDHLGNVMPDTPQIVLVNSHNRTSLYKLFIGIYRWICSNGLMDGRTTARLEISHRGNILDNVINGTYSLAKQSLATLEVVEAMKNTQLTEGARLALAYWAMYARFGEAYEDVPYTPYDFLTTHRPEDNYNDLYTVFNVLQSNLVGNDRRISGQGVDGRQHSLRGINAIDKVVQFNTDLWNYALDFIH